MHETSTRRRELAWLVFAVVLFLLQTVPYLSRRWVTDESWYAGPGYSIAQGHGVRDPEIGPNDLENRFDARPPGTALVIAGFFKLFSPGPAVARFGSVLAGLGIVLLTYRLSRDVLGAEGAVFASLVVATDNLIVLSSRTARPEALVVMTALLGLYGLKRYYDQGSAGWAFVAGVWMAAATMFHITILGYIVGGGLLIIAIDAKQKRFVLRGALLYTAGFAVGLVPFATWILTAPLGKIGFHQEFLSRAVDMSLWGKFVGEWRRYSDVLGFKMLHGHGLESLPVRAPIPLCFVIASVLLWRFRRSWFYVELVLLVPSVLWLIYTVNKSSRYISVLAPVFALTIGAAVAATRGKKMERAVVWLAAFVVAMQAGANLYLLKQAGQANYARVGTELRALVPEGETTYASIVFWMDFYDRPFISYERTEPGMALHEDHARYFIMGDRTMVNGMPGDESFYAKLNRDLAAMIAQGTLVGSVDDAYYGHLTVYRLRD